MPAVIALLAMQRAAVAVKTIVGIGVDVKIVDHQHAGTFQPQPNKAGKVEHGVSIAARRQEERRMAGIGIEEALLELATDLVALLTDHGADCHHHAAALGAETRLIRLNELKFRACEGYYSKAAGACTWPCSISQMDADDGLNPVYEALVHWADAVIIATPIRWGAASSLYFKMAERLNCVQNAMTIRNQVLIRNKVAGFIIVGGQDNIQAVAGHMLGFFAELGFIFPQFPYIAHSRGWSHEDMERNVDVVRDSTELAEGAAMLAKRCLELAGQLIARNEAPTSIERGGRKAHAMHLYDGAQGRAVRDASLIKLN